MNFCITGGVGALRLHSLKFGLVCPWASLSNAAGARNSNVSTSWTGTNMSLSPMR